MPDRAPDSEPARAAPSAGNSNEAARLIAEVYDQLRILARKKLANERDAISLQPTALVHDAYLRMVHVRGIEFEGKTHFFALAATQMRRILVERARAAGTRKRGHGATRIALSEELMAVDEPGIDVLTVDQALTTLARRNPRRARIAELRLFSGMQIDEIASEIGVSEKTVRVDWKKARVSLARTLGGPASSR